MSVESSNASTNEQVPNSCCGYVLVELQVIPMFEPGLDNTRLISEPILRAQNN